MLCKVKKFNVGGSVSDDDDESADILNDEVGEVPQYISPEQRSNLMLRPLTSQLLQAQEDQDNQKLQQ
jgi:hypothetical protein